MSADDKNLVPAVSPEERELDDTFVMGTYGRLPVEFVGGHGATLVDAEGNEYLDLLGGIGCASLGYGHPAVVEALREQADRIWQVGNYFYVEHRGERGGSLGAPLRARGLALARGRGERRQELRGRRSQAPAQELARGGGDLG